MKLRDYFLLSMVVTAVFACSSDDEIPEEQVFTPDATFSLAAEVNGKTGTKAIQNEIKNAEDAIHTLRVLVFSGQTDEAPYQTEGSSTNTNVVEDIPVESGEATILVLANDQLSRDAFVGKTLSEALNLTFSLDNESLESGLTMSSALLKTNIAPNMHNIYGNLEDFADSHQPNVSLGGVIDLVRHIAQINLKSLTINKNASFVLEEMFVANVKGYTNVAANSLSKWGPVETETAPTDGKLWWYGDCVEDNGKYKTIEEENAVKKEAILSWSPTSPTTVEFGKGLKPAEGEFSYGKSFYVYENNLSGNAPLGERTLLILKGTYIGSQGEEKNRFYTVSVNDPDMGTLTENDGTVSHKYIKRNYRYNISLNIKSSGSDRPYDPASEACMDIAISVANWDVVDMNENLD